MTPNNTMGIFNEPPPQSHATRPFPHASCETIKSQHGSGGGGADGIGGEHAEQPARELEGHAEQRGDHLAGRGHAQGAGQQGEHGEPVGGEDFHGGGGSNVSVLRGFFCGGGGVGGTVSSLAMAAMRGSVLTVVGEGAGFGIILFLARANEGGASQGGSKDGQFHQWIGKILNGG